MPDEKYRYRLDRRFYGDWVEYGDYAEYEDALFAKEEAFMADHLEDSHYNYRIVEYRTLYDDEDN